MDKSKLAIASVQLNDRGMKGIVVEYMLPSIKGNVQFADTYKSKRKAPIHTELEECFGWLKSHLLDICGYTLEKEEREYLMNALEVTAIKYGDKGFEITGELSILSGQKVLTLKTPLISDEIEYFGFNEVVNIAKGIYAETAEYMAGKKVMSDMQIVARFNAKNEEFDMAAFKRMTKAEQRDIATKILEDQGCMVFHNDEIIEDNGEVVDTTNEQDITIKGAPTLIPDETIVPETTVTTNTADEDDDFAVPTNPGLNVAITEEEEEFSLPIKMPVAKKSTAKKKVA